MTAKVAIITRTKNRPLLLKRAALSVLGQSFQHWVWVVVNDGGDPNPVSQVLEPHRKALKDRLIRVDNPESVGMEAASNRGIHASESRYLVIHDDDDSWESGFLDATVGILENKPHPLVRAAATHCTEIREALSKEQVSEISRRPYNKHLLNLTLANFLKENKTPPICFVYERQVHESIGYYAEDMRVLGDWEFFLRFYRQYEAVMIPRALANYHIRPAKSAGAYGNSVTADVDLHAFHGQLLWNRLLREDLDAGRFGIGSLIASIQAAPRPAGPAADDGRFRLLMPVLEARSCGHREAIVCGSGEAGRQVARLARLLDIQIHAFTDGNERLWGSEVERIPVRSLEQGIGMDLPCLIGSLAFAEEIRSQIHALCADSGTQPPPIFSP